MVEFYLKFWRENRDVLLDGELKPFAPELAYPLVKAETQDKLLIMEQQDEINRGTISELRAQLNLMSEEMMDLEFQLQESERLRSQLEEDLAGYQAGTAQAASATPLATPSATPSPAPTAAPMVTEEASEKADSTVQP